MNTAPFTPFPSSSLRRLMCGGALALAAAMPLPAFAATVTLNTAPFTGSTALDTPGRQVFSGLEQTLPSFDVHTDAFVVTTGLFGISGPLSFVNASAAGIPPSGFNVIVLQDFDNDNNPTTPFGAGTAASLIAAQVSADGAGFFVYHNSGLGVNRLVFSTNLNDNTADLSVMARIASPTGLDAINTLGQFRNDNFTAAVPEPSTYALLAIGLAGLAWVRRRPQA